MADVFISYKQDERERMRPLADRLRGLGVDVWFDERLSPDKAFTEEIQTIMNQCRAQLVCWSEAAVKSEWVRGEAEVGRQRGVLISVTIEPCTLPPPFNMLHAENLGGWSGDPTHPGWRKVAGAIGGKLGRPGLGELAGLQGSSDAEAWRKWAGKYADDPHADEAWAKAEELHLEGERARLAREREAAKQRAHGGETPAPAPRQPELASRPLRRRAPNWLGWALACVVVVAGVAATAYVFRDHIASMTTPLSAEEQNLRDLERRWATEPTPASAEALARAHAAAENWAAAVVVLQEALALTLTPTDRARLRTALGNALVEGMPDVAYRRPGFNDKFNAALEAAASAVEDAPNDAEAHLLLGRLLGSRDGPSSEALAALERARLASRDDNARAFALFRMSSLIVERQIDMARGQAPATGVEGSQQRLAVDWATEAFMLDGGNAEYKQHACYARILFNYTREDGRYVCLAQGSAEPRDYLLEGMYFLREAEWQNSESGILRMFANALRSFEEGQTKLTDAHAVDLRDQLEMGRRFALRCARMDVSSWSPPEAAREYFIRTGLMSCSTTPRAP